MNRFRVGEVPRRKTGRIFRTYRKTKGEEQSVLWVLPLLVVWKVKIGCGGEEGCI